ncbi:MAG TPA: adenylate/guanylate cyclase domain-containing protein [Acidimicrobiales bacterium]|nr:adenylate/guanylate cyclase domain-containing protein [Acidimicrobiales bacterium]
MLRPYVARLAVALQSCFGDDRLAPIEGTLAFVDVSGFTRLTEILAGKGKAGAEELSELLDVVFAGLLTISDDLGGELIKWGGDAVLLLYTGAAHAERATAAAAGMQARMRHLGRLRTSCGPCTLRISVGIHSGRFHFLMVGRRHRELLIVGPGATMTATMEGIAEAGEIVVSSTTAALLPKGSVVGAKESGWLIEDDHRFDVPERRLPEPPADLSPALCVPEKLRTHLLAGPVVSEHRQVAVAFIEYLGTDAPLAGQHTTVVDDLDDLVSRAQESCATHDVAFWETDISKDGGKIMLVAGAPSGTDDDGGRLLAVLHETMGAATRLPLRAGATYGRVFTGQFGPANRRTYTVKGDTVNLAARLMARAGIGEIYASEQLLRRSGVQFAAEPLEPFLVKGKVEPVRARRLVPAGGSARTVGTDPAPPPPGSELPFVGRSEELEVLLACLSDAAVGHGGWVEVLGPPGIGKSRLIDEVVALAPDHDVLRVRCDHYRSHQPYAAARQLGRQSLGVAPDADPELVGKVLAGAVSAAAPELTPWLPLLADVIGADVPPTPESAALDEAFRPGRLREVYARLLRALLTRPTLLVVDNVHDMDDASAGVLGRIATAASTAPWSVALLGRGRARSLQVDERGRRACVGLDALGPEESSRLLRAATSAQPLSHRRAAAIVERSEGNPLFLLELAGSAGGLGEDALPDSVESLFAARIDELPPPDRYVLRVASVLGHWVTVSVLEAMVEGGVPPDRLATLGDFLAEDGVDSLRFRNKMLRDAAYEGLAFSQRARLHGLAGAALEQLSGGSADVAGLLAFHFGRAGVHEKAWRYGRAAAARATEVHAHADAASLFEQALEAGRRLRGVGRGDRFVTAQAVGDSYSRAGEFLRADAAYRVARRWASEGVERTELNYKVASVAERCGSYARALRVLTIAERSVHLAPSPDRERVLARLRALRGLVRHRQGRGAEAVVLLRAAVRHARTADAPDLLAEALVHLDEAELTVGEPGDGEHAREALAVLRRVGGYLWLEGQAYNQLGIRAYFAGRWPEAVGHYRASADATKRSGDDWAAAVATGNIAEVLSDQGHLVEARDLLEEMLPAYRAAGTPSFVAYGALLWGRLAARSGCFDEALAALAEAEAIYRAEREVLAVAHSRALLAEARVLAGDHAGARAAVEGCLADLERLAGGNLIAPLALRVGGVAALLEGDEAVGRQRIELSVTVARARSAPYELALSLQALTDLLPGVVSATERNECRGLCEQLGLTEDARHLLAVAGCG